MNHNQCTLMLGFLFVAKFYTVVINSSNLLPSMDLYIRYFKVKAAVEFSKLSVGVG